MAELTFRDGIMDRILLYERRFDERAYLFVLAALEYCQQRLSERRHITGRELSWACRDLALDRFGVMARPVLEHWGVRTSSDIGDVVFTLVDLGFLLSQPSDTRDEFAGAFDFDEAFERAYPWCGAIPA
ncbi:MAG: Minf_1886 family protein [Gemmatimonadaceae bacterium]|nr:Minf_1886 family protein [Gemmatimonadaceae bacterium]